ncbi:MAG: hypothetical protein AAF431_16105 [Pseudomonadota bacterium]
MTPPTAERWPESMPPRAIFVEAHERQQAANTNQNSLNSHLTWIKRFYLGSIIYPLGWNRMTEILLDTVEQDEVINELMDRMYQLGVTICVEWAQDNDKRLIDSAAIAVWGNALRTAADLGEQLEFVGKVEQDVAGLLAGELSLQEIKRERYYPPEDYDNF